MPLTIVSQSPAFTIAVDQSLIIFENRAEMGLLGIEKLDVIETHIGTTHGQFTTMVIVSAFVTKPPDAEIRVAASALAKKHEAKTRAVAFVITQGGMSAVMVRTFLSGYFMVTHTTFPQQVFKRVDDALEWLAAQPGVDPAVHSPTLEDEIRALVTQRAA